jgi:hypothetical protein
MLVKPAEDFTPDRRRLGGRYPFCKPCAKKKQKWYAMKSMYGVTKEQYEAKFFAQNGLCEICHKPSLKPLNVDHNHETGKVRGLICLQCNHAIGLFRENLDSIKSAVVYLEKYQHDDSTASNPNRKRQNEND